MVTSKSVYPLIKGFGDTIRHSWEDIEVPKIGFKPKRIVVVGMGANYNAGLLLKEMLRDEIRVEVYQRPFIGDKDELVIFLSYSGNTREVLNVYDKTLGKNFLVVSSGGNLLSWAKKRHANIIEIPPHLHPRFTFSECFFPVLRCLGESKIIKKKGRMIRDICEVLEREEMKIEREAKKLAGYILKDDKIPLFYSTEYFWPVAYRFQSSLSEDDKIVCHANRITELFHNELEAIPSEKFFPILFIDKKEAWNYLHMIEFFKNRLGKFFYFGYERYPREVRSFLAFSLAYYLGFYLALGYKNKIPMGETPISDEIKTK